MIRAASGSSEYVANNLMKRIVKNSSFWINLSDSMTHKFLRIFLLPCLETAMLMCLLRCSPPTDVFQETLQKYDNKQWEVIQNVRYTILSMTLGDTETRPKLL